VESATRLARSVCTASVVASLNVMVKYASNRSPQVRTHA
jgi:hypothetical protein